MIKIDGQTVESGETMRLLRSSKNNRIRTLIRDTDTVRVKNGKDPLNKAQAAAMQRIRASPTGRELETSLVEKYTKRPAFRHTNNPRRFMTKDEPPLLETMKAEKEKLTMLQDINKIKIAFQATSDKDLYEKVIQSYREKLNTVRSFQQKANELSGDDQLYDQLRAEAGAVGLGTEDPLTAEFLQEKIAQYEEKLKEPGVETSYTARLNMTKEGMNEILSDVVQHGGKILKKGAEKVVYFGTDIPKPSAAGNRSTARPFIPNFQTLG